MTIEFRRCFLTSRFRSPGGSADVEARLEVRRDPLLGTSSRVVDGVRLQTADPEALRPLLTSTGGCPFCPDRLTQVTPQFPSFIASEGRIRNGETTVIPNIVPYSQYAAVAVFSPRHWLSLTDFTPTILADNLTAVVWYVRSVVAADSSARFCAYNVNYLYPSGGSLPHPHAQVYLDPLPTTMLRLLHEASTHYWKEHGTNFYCDLTEAERQRESRFIGRIGSTSWMTPFAPLGFNEVRAVVAERETLLDLTQEDIEALATGISKVLSWYDAAGYNSFNLALYSAPLDGAPGFRVNLTMITRSALVPYYRSDAMYLERLHWEAALDRTPEDVASDVRSWFESPAPDTIKHNRFEST